MSYGYHSLCASCLFSSSQHIPTACLQPSFPGHILQSPPIGASSSRRLSVPPPVAASRLLLQFPPLGASSSLRLLMPPRADASQHLLRPQLSSRVMFFEDRPSKRALLLVYENGDCSKTKDLFDPKNDSSFEELCGESVFVDDSNTNSLEDNESWGLLNGQILARVFHFLRSDMKTLLLMLLVNGGMLQLSSTSSYADMLTFHLLVPVVLLLCFGVLWFLKLRIG